LRALLRQQLIVLGRNTKTPRLAWRERLSLVCLARWVPNWKQVLQIIQPDTQLRWYREGFRLFWKLKSRKQRQTQPQHLAAERKEYVSYFNPAQPHQGIAQRIPAPRAPPPGMPMTSRVIAGPVLNGLHYDYRWAAA